MEALSRRSQADWEQRSLALLDLEEDPLRPHGPSRVEGLPFYLVFLREDDHRSYRQHPLLLPPILQEGPFLPLATGDPTLGIQHHSPGVLEVLGEQDFDSLVVLKMGWLKR